MITIEFKEGESNIEITCDSKDIKLRSKVPSNHKFNPYYFLTQFSDIRMQFDDSGYDSRIDDIYKQLYAAMKEQGYDATYTLYIKDYFMNGDSLCIEIPYREYMIINNKLRNLEER